MKSKLLIVLTIAVMASSAFASQMGVSTHPFTMKKQVVSTEFNNYLGGADGMGLNARYYQRLNEKTNIDFGVGVTDGSYANRIFAGADFELFPDYGNQPRVSIKGLIGTQEIDGQRINNLGAAPAISKGMSFWGKEGFPYLALPVNVALNDENSTYTTTVAMAAGITGRLPWDGYENLIGNVELNYGLNEDSFDSIVMGVSLPLQ